MKTFLAIVFCAFLVCFASNVHASEGLWWTSNGTVIATFPAGTTSNGTTQFYLGTSTFSDGKYHFVRQGSNNGVSTWQEVSTVYAPTSGQAFQYPSHYAWLAPVSGTSIGTIPTPTPTPTPTPSPSPTPHPFDDKQAYIVHGSVGVLPSGVRAFVKYRFTDTAGDAVMVEAGTNGDWNILLTGADSSRPYEVSIGYFGTGANGELVKLYEIGARGQLPTYDGENSTSQSIVPPYETPTIAKADVGTVTHADGTATHVQEFTVTNGSSGSGNGTITFTSGSSSGGGRTVFVSGGVPSGSGAGGSFVSSGASSDSIDLADIKNLLRQGNLDRNQGISEMNQGFRNVVDSISSLTSNLTGSNSTATPTPTPTPEPEESGSASSTFNPIGIQGAQSVSFTPPGNGVSWVIRMPGSNQTVDLDPTKQAWFMALANWIRMILWWCATIWITWHVYSRINNLIRDCFAVLESADINRLSHAGQNKFGILGTVAFGLLNISGFGIIKSIAVSLLWKAALIAAILIFVGLVGGQILLWGGGDGNWFIGGGTLVQSLATALIPSTAALQTSVYLLCLFIPMDHFLNCGVVWLATEAVYGLILGAFAWFTRFMS